MSDTGTKALEDVISKIEAMSDKEFLEICDIASERRKQYEKDLEKFNAGIE